jgi:hypothetical protein
MLDNLAIISIGGIAVFAIFIIAGFFAEWMDWE